jgi:DNA-binding transcriptional LysR family regulator
LPLQTANLRYLEVFQVVMRTRNLTVAARLLNVTQPAVSHALKELEAQIGFVLFHRSHGPVRPTDEAVQLLPDIERLFAQLGLFALRVSELKDEHAGQLTIATVPSLAGRVLPRALAAFRKVRPRVHFKFLVNTVADVVGLVKDEIADLGFAFSPIDQIGITSEKLIDTRMVAYISSALPLAKKSCVATPDLAGIVAILPTQQTVPGQVLRRFLDAREMHAIDILECNNAAAAVSLVREGMGIAVMDPLSIGDGLPGSVVCRPFEPFVPVAMMVLHSRHREISRVASEFMGHVRVAAGEEAIRLSDMGIASSVGEPEELVSVPATKSARSK